MQVQLGLAVSAAVKAAGGPPLQAARFAAVNADGWTADYPTPPALDPVGNPETFSVARAGYDANGQATTHVERLTVTRRVRQAFPNQAALTARTVSLSDYVYATDTVAGAANASTEQSPRPVANWVVPDRQTIGDTVTLEIVAFHRNGREREQVACVEFSATDGATTVSQIVSASTVSPRTTDRNAVIVYRCVLNVAALANPAVITCNARVYPWIGTAAAVRDSAAESAPRAFSPRIFWRNTARRAAPPLAYVSTSGNDATGLVSTGAAAAKAAPFLTVLGAIRGLKAAAAVTGGRIDGCEVRLGAGTFAAGSLATTDVTGGIQDHAALRITRDPDVAKSAAVFTFGAAAFRTRFPYLTIADCTVQRTGTQAIQGETAVPLHLVLDDVVFDNAGHNATILSSAGLYVNGCELAQAGSLPFAPGASEVRMLRGLSCASGVTVESWLVVGCRLTGGNHGANLFWNGSRSSNGAIAAFNYFSGYRLGYGGLAETMACAVVQNVVEFTSATPNPAFSLSADSAPASTSHAILLHNTFAGFWNNGRTNAFYDETVGTPRTHRLLVSKGNIAVSMNNKGDVFLSDGSRTGNWPFLYGVGCAGELHQFDAAAVSFRQEFPGLAALIGTSQTVPVDPLFTAPAHTLAGPAAGPGGGSYSLQPGSPARGLVAQPALRFDLAGAARAAAGASAGAYE